jgi:hypothetical protein
MPHLQTNWQKETSNKERQKAAQSRRRAIIETLVDYELCPGWKSWLAEHFGVHRGTICRDIEEIVKSFRASGFKGLGPRTNAKVKLLGELTNWVEEAKQRRIRSKAIRELKKETEVNRPIPSSLKPSTLPQMKPTNSEQHQFPHCIPRRESRYDRMRCFPR